MNVYLPNLRLPSAYQEVEYIQSSGTQYINTLFTPSASTIIETDIQRGTQDTNWAVFFGVTGNDSSSNGILGRIYDSTSTNLNPWFCNTTYGECQITGTAINTWHNIILKSGSCKLDGTSYTITTNSTPYQSTIDIFAGNNGGTHGWRAGKCKIKSFKIYTGGTLERDFIPCYRKSDNVIGLYDLVNSVFYINSGTGTFSKGNDVTMAVLKNAYIGEVWTPGENTLFYASLNGNYNSEGTLNPSYNTSSGVTYPSLGNIQYAYVNNGQMAWNIGTPPINTITFQAWVNGISEGVLAVGNPSWEAGAKSTSMELYFSGTQRAVYTQKSDTWYGTGSNSSTNTWYLVTGVKNGTTLTLYKNGTSIGSVTCANTFDITSHIIIANNNRNPVTNTSMKVSNIIFEDKAWSSTEVSIYYNQTKSNYGL